MAATNNISNLPILCNSDHLAPHSRCHHIITGSHGRVWSGCWLSCPVCLIERRAEREGVEAEAEARRRASFHRCDRCSETVRVG